MFQCLNVLGGQSEIEKQMIMALHIFYTTFVIIMTDICTPTNTATKRNDENQ